MENHSQESDQHLAERIRAVLVANAFVLDSRELVAEYQRRADRINARLTLARGWLRKGLLSEAIGGAEEYPDAVDAARDLDLGRDNLAKLVQGCRDFGMEIPTGVMLDAAWELSTAYELYRAAKVHLDRYRAACMAGLPPALRIDALRDACVAVRNTKSLLGPAGDAIERTLATQARPLCDMLLAELRREAVEVMQSREAVEVMQSREAVEVIQSREAKRAESWRESFGQFIDAVASLNESGANVVYDFQANPTHRELQRLKDRLDADRILKGIDVLYRAGNAESLRKELKQWADIEARRLVSVDVEKAANLQKARNFLANDDAKQNIQREAQDRLRAMISDPLSTKEQRQQAYEKAVMGALMTPPDLFLEHRRRNEKDDKLAKQAIDRAGRLQLRDSLERRKQAAENCKRRVIIVVSSIILISGAGIGGFQGWKVYKNRSDRELNTAKAIDDFLKAGKVDEAVKKLENKPAYSDYFFAEQSNKIEAFRVMIRENVETYESRMHAVNEYKAAAVKIAEDPAKALDAARQLEEICDKAPELGKERRDHAKNLIDSVREAANRVIADNDLIATKIAELSKRASEAERREAQTGEATLLEEYRACMQEFTSIRLKNRAMSNQVSAKFSAAEESLKQKLRELDLRTKIATEVGKGSGTLAAFVDLYSQYVDCQSDRRPKLMQALKLVLKDSAALKQASLVYDPLNFPETSVRPSSEKEARQRKEACGPGALALLGLETPSQLEPLERYFAAQERLLGSHDELGLIETDREFSKAAWKQVTAVVGDDGRKFYSLGGGLSRAGEGMFSLSQCIKHNNNFNGKDKRFATQLVGLASAKALQATPTSSLAAEAVATVKSALEGKIDPLQVHMFVAQRIRTAEIPGPLKAQRLLVELRAQKSAGWGLSQECAAVIEWIEAAGSKLGDDAPWTPDASQKQEVRDASHQFEQYLAGVPDFEQVARDEMSRVLTAARQVQQVRFFGIAWSTAPGAVAVRSGVASKLGSLVYRITADPASQARLQRVGQIASDGRLDWSSDGPPPDGTPLIVINRETK